MTPAYFAEKPEAPPPPKRFSSIRERTPAEKRAATQKLRAGSKKPKKKAKKRDRNDKARIYGGDYAKWIRSLPCIGCGYKGPHVQAAHTENGGIGRKADARTLVPLCGRRLQKSFAYRPAMFTSVEGCHEFAHRVGHRTLEKVYRINLKAKAAELFAQWSGGAREESQ
jgi:hypothetical protein